jgi:integrase
MAGEGSVFRRTTDGLWVAQLSIGGRANRRYATRGAKTRGAALAALEDLKAERRIGLNPSKQPLGSYLRTWLDESARPTISANTYRGYEDALAHLEPMAGLPLAEVTAEDIERCCNAMRSRRGRVSAPASPKTVRNVQVMLRRALGQAEARGHVRRNVARLVPLRKVPRFKVAALTPERAREILAAVAGDRYEAGYALGLIGLRASEILGLAWEDLDMDAAMLSIRYQLVGSGSRARRGDAKTEASETTIPLPAFVVIRLREHRRRQLAERVAAGVPTGDGLIFVTRRGFAVNASWLTKHFQVLLTTAGLPRMRLHDLRHGAASLLVDAGAHPRVATELLRHAPGSRMTMERYAHVTARQQRDAVDLLEKAIVG